jgi:hypothetical protein
VRTPNAILDAGSAISTGFRVILPAAIVARAPYWIAKAWPNIASLIQGLMALLFLISLLACIGFAMKRRQYDAFRAALIGIGALLADISIEPIA